MKKKLSIFGILALVALIFIGTPKAATPQQPLTAPGSATFVGTGACLTMTTQKGGAFTGQVTCTGTTGVATVTITPSQTAINGFQCSGSDATNTLAGSQRNVANNSCQLNFTAVTSGDVVTFELNPY
jgi:hypothetical protein